MYCFAKFRISDSRSISPLFLPSPAKIGTASPRSPLPFGSPNSFLLHRETTASFFYHLFESSHHSSLRLFRLLLRCFAQLRYFLHARDGTAHDRRGTLPGPAVYSPRRFFLKFLRHGIKSPRDGEERQCVICASQ